MRQGRARGTLFTRNQLRIIFCYCVCHKEAWLQPEPSKTRNYRFKHSAGVQMVGPAHTHPPTHIHTNTHTPTHHPRQVCLLCLCCTALHVFSQGQSERCPRSHQEKITLNVFRCLAATNNQTLKSHFPFTELLSLETFRSFYITWRQKHRDHSQDQM